MDLRELVERIGQTYDRAQGQQGEAQELLKRAPDVLADLLPAGYMPEASGGKGNAAIVPWIAVFDPDETTSAQDGIYVVYLFAADMSAVTLSLNQGVTELNKRLGAVKGRAQLASQAAAIRGALVDDTTDLQETIDLRSRAPLPRSYEAGNILALRYEIGALPAEAAMQTDLHRFVRLYEAALATRDRLRASEPETILTTTPAKSDDDGEFKPKNDAEYIQVIKQRRLRKSRKHETLVRTYGEFLQSRGFKANTKVHPRDLTAEQNSEHWLIEAKMVHRGNGPHATREALAQLLMYSNFLYPEQSQVHMLALFSESIGPRCVAFLEKYSIASVWKEGRTWAGSPTATAKGLAETLG